MKTAKIVLIALIVLLAVRPSFVWMGHQDFDYDEAGQFWMAKGLHHFSEPNAKDGTIADIIENNRYYNLDPGGFTLLLRFWARISNDIHFLRALPVLFYWLFVFAMFLLGRLLFKSDLWGLLFASLAVLPNLHIPYFSIPFTIKSGYLRAYSMEMCGIAFSIFYWVKHKDHLSVKKILAFSFFLSFFCTARYGFLITAFAISLRVLFILFESKTNFSDFVAKILLYSVPLLCVVSLIYFLETRYQNPNANVPDYDTSLYQTPTLLLGWMSVSYFCVLGYSAYQYLIRKKKLNEWIVLSNIVGCVFMVLSLLDKYPWAPTKTAPVMILTQFSLMYIVLDFCREKWKERTVSIVAVMILLLVNIGSWPSSIKSYNIYRNSEKIETIISLKDSEQSVLVSAGMNPICRHLFEYGVLKESGYPSNFSFLPDESLNATDYVWYLWNPTADTSFPQVFEPVQQYVGKSIKRSSDL